MKRQSALRFGATDEVDPGSGDPVEQVKGLTGGRGVDFAFEAVGVEQLQLQALEMTRRGGTTVLVGVAGRAAGLALPTLRMVMEDRTVKGSYYGSARVTRDYPRIIELIETGRVDLGGMVTKHFTLEEVNLGAGRDARWRSRARRLGGFLTSTGGRAAMPGDDRPMGLTDPLFEDPYVDLDEWRDEPVRHRYVHGGFHGSDCRFSMYFPEARRYQGRFFHPVTPVPGTEHSATEGLHVGYIGFSVASGGYLVESNLGLLRRALPGEDSTIAGFRASAAVATYSRVLAAEMYGEHRPYGYVFGGSGGGYRTMACIENTRGVWDGAVPYIHPTPMSLPANLGVQAHAMRVLRDKLPQIVDAVEPGGERRHVRRPHRRGARRARGGRPAWASRRERGSTPSGSPCSTRRSGRGSSTTWSGGTPRTSTTSGRSPATSARTRPIRSCTHSCSTRPR